MVFNSRLMIFLTTAELKCVGTSGNWLITVFKPIDDMSLSCSLSESMFVHNVSTISSTWNSFTFDTSGPKLEKKRGNLLEEQCLFRFIFIFHVKFTI